MTRSWNKVLVAAACGFVSVGSVRNAKKHQLGVAPSQKVIAKVPVLNYDLAYGGGARAHDGALENWILVADGAASDEQLSSLCALSKCLRTGHPSKGGMAYLEIRGTEFDLEKIISGADGLIEFVEPDSRVEMIPDEDGDEASASWGLDRIGASTRGSTGSGTHIFVLDTGILSSHRDFGGRVVPTLDMTGGSMVLCKGDLNCARDSQGHGSHCAGTAAGETFGVAPEAVLHTVKVLGDDGSGSWSWSYDALDFLATSNIRPAVASMSLGGQGTQNAMETAVDTAVSAGVTVVVAGGNSNGDACGFSPAFVPSAITVGSTTSTNRRSSFSNYGSCTDIWAPGSDIVSASHTSDTGSRSLSGTSMACPHVSGAAALILENSPSFSSANIIDEMLAKADRNWIADLKSGDTNALLFVGAQGGSEGPIAPTQAPPATQPPTSCGGWGRRRRNC